ncbi:MAG: methylated-DNA--[protein]-cysteine S-methyltransferase [Chitinophagaceae bacterium]|nr:MAG: methylated-DNA--[protein]-cysteine S-methyltransferase [Chitinophagaceae bacterium]
MSEQSGVDFNRMADAIDYLKCNFTNQPDLETVAKQVHLSPFHFQRMFREWVGVSPKQFVQYLTAERAKDILRTTASTLSDVAFETGLSGTGRLHDLFIKIEGMTPGEYKNGADGLVIDYSFSQTPFGEVLIASTAKGICYLTFTEGEQQHAYRSLKTAFPNALCRQQTNPYHVNALRLFTKDWSRLEEVKLHLRGTAFQLKVWESLIKIPPGALVSYSTLAMSAGFPGASRASGTAVGSNPIAYIIPCHRVIRSDGTFGQYRWDNKRKTAMIGWEAVLYNEELLMPTEKKLRTTASNL